jgi:hypothetical protein
MNSRAKQYYNSRHQKASLVRKRKKIFLLQQNIKTKQLYNKLDHKKLRPFRIKERIELLNYKLELPETIKIHLIFYILLLEKALQNAQQQEVEVKSEVEYKIDRILNNNKINSQEYYLVK